MYSAKASSVSGVKPLAFLVFANIAPLWHIYSKVYQSVLGFGNMIFNPSRVIILPFVPRGHIITLSVSTSYHSL
jgi:hypothetical protein